MRSGRYVDNFYTYEEIFPDRWVVKSRTEDINFNCQGAEYARPKMGEITAKNWDDYLPEDIIMERGYALDTKEFKGDVTFVHDLFAVENFKGYYKEDREVPLRGISPIYEYISEAMHRMQLNGEHVLDSRAINPPVQAGDTVHIRQVGRPTVRPYRQEYMGEWLEPGQLVEVDI